MFILHPKLEQDSFFITDLPLCRALLINNAVFPWMILVPRSSSYAREIIELCLSDRHRLMDEIAFASEVLRGIFGAHKLNIAALGNQVEQLHIHVIARFKNDAAWPNPVWGHSSQPYADPEPLIRQIATSFLLGARASSA